MEGELEALEQSLVQAESERRAKARAQHEEELSLRRKLSAAWRKLEWRGWSDCLKSLCQFRSDLDAAGLTELVATSVEGLLSVVDDPHWVNAQAAGTERTLYEILRLALRGERDELKDRLTALCRTNDDASWASTIGQHSWESLLWNPEIEKRREWWAAEDARLECRITLDMLAAFNPRPAKKTIQNRIDRLKNTPDAFPAGRKEGREVLYEYRRLVPHLRKHWPEQSWPEDGNEILTLFAGNRKCPSRNDGEKRFPNPP